MMGLISCSDSLIELGEALSSFVSAWTLGKVHSEIWECCKKCLKFMWVCKDQLSVLSQ